MTQPYAKTPAGQAEMAQRSDRLSRPLRSLLVCVDGQRDRAALDALAASIGAPADAVQQLCDLGLIAPQAASTVPSNAPQPAAATAAAKAAAPTTAAAAAPAAAAAEAPVALAAPDRAADPADTAQAYRQLYATMTELARQHLGMIKSYAMQLKIEQCADLAQLRALLPELQEALAAKLGKAQARGVVQALQADSA